ncbi:hypothetical protein D3C77_689290 [compost metagenome]
MELISLLPARKVLDAEPKAIARSICLVRRYWPALSTVAQYLHAQGTVNGDEISALLSTLTGETPTRQANPLSSLDSRRCRPVDACLTG